ncbi:hypothetical protein SDC9_164979 [bioreactor metagenome]|uniref:Uncharacterized protein n=1 Tax=bioreactor metagenome TaxID=1076179 RepID=A0A645G0J0_9ZZZZ
MLILGVNAHLTKLGAHGVIKVFHNRDTQWGLFENTAVQGFIEGQFAIEFLQTGVLEQDVEQREGQRQNG